MSGAKKTRGRQKIEMKKMSNESNLQVTFSKRRSGLFKKASELCTLCGAYIALIIFSPSEKVFSFGYPNVETVIDRYLSLIPPQNDGIMEFMEDFRRAKVRELNGILTRMNDAIDIDKNRENELNQQRKMNGGQFWWTRPIDEMNMVQLDLLKKALEDLQKLVRQHADRVEMQGTSTQALPFFVGNGSSSNMPIEHQPNPQQESNFSADFFHNHMLQPHLFGFNIMGGQDGHGPHGFV
ncbi:putative transcription factor MADS-type1 family [Medicago truncatula]|uniref:MADS-box transcription factor family protein n=1 Tax=Medicago truncatula TaxID=3880 RepID=G7IRB0_MEDTR|nr:agamous-like MADS-box protein AGL62 [Medicago truncatula]AES67005.1 MADS-box transcription factor family protein [Medicago truncatula]RHN75097.1 putative transcription factor MADS-type1 family [Medicago truncatula]